MSVSGHWLACTASGGTYRFDLLSHAEAFAASYPNVKMTVEGPFVSADQLQGAVEAERERVLTLIGIAANMVEAEDSTVASAFRGLAKSIRLGGQCVPAGTRVRSDEETR